MTENRDIQFNFDNSFTRSLEGYFVPWDGAKVSDPQIIKLNTDLAEELGLDALALDSSLGAEILSGSRAPYGTQTVAQVYAGHQFGGFSPRLGDGRALLLGELIDIHGKRRDIHLKGSGATPFSRRGDGKAALGPVLREYIVGEAMYALGIPTTRALAAVSTGEDVVRETILPGAVLARVASSHIRVGTFQYFAAQGNFEKVRLLADYTIERHYPHLKQEENPYLALLETVQNAQALLVAKWMNVGFVHGVMNTDNMTVSGETIDYGPCAFMEHYAPDTVYSSIDEGGRYAYKNQPLMAQWNLTRLAESLLPLIDENQDKAIEKASDIIRDFPETYAVYWLDGMKAKLGLTSVQGDDLEIANDFLIALEGQKIDYTLVFRNLAKAAEGNDEVLFAMFDDPTAMKNWLQKWYDRCAKEKISPSERAELMKQVNPIYIPRNHKVEEALSAAVSEADYSKFERLIEVLSDPYKEVPGQEKYAQPAPDDFGCYKTFCGT